MSTRERSVSACPRVIGTPGGGLLGPDGRTPDWAVNAEVARQGRSGELRTAEVVDRLARTTAGPTVLHDLRIPVPGISANIDHVVVAGHRVFIVDSKTWAPGRYWTLFGATRRGWRRFRPAEKQTMRMAAESLGRYLTGRNLAARVECPLVVVWPSSRRRPLSLWALSVPGARVVPGHVFARTARRLFGAGPVSMVRDRRHADPHVVAALRELVADAPQVLDPTASESQDLDPFGPG